MLRGRPEIIGPMSSLRRRGEAESFAEEGTVVDEDVLASLERGRLRDGYWRGD